MLSNVNDADRSYQEAMERAERMTAMLEANIEEHINELWDDKAKRVDFLAGCDLDNEQHAMLAGILYAAENMPEPYKSMCLDLRKSFDDLAEEYIYDHATDFLR